MPAHVLEIQGLLAPALPARARCAAVPRQRGLEPGSGRARLAVSPELLARCREGDAGAFEALFEKAKDHVYTLALHFCGDEPTAADVTQEVFVKLLERIGQFREDSEFSTWLYRVVRNVFLDHHRAGKRWTPLQDLADAEEAPRELVLDAAQEDGASRSHAAAAVRRAVAALAPRWRLPVVLRYGAGLAYEEIAEVLGVSPGTVASRLSRAHARLAKKLGHLRS